MTERKDVVLVSDHPMTMGVQFLMDHVMRQPALDAAYRMTGILCSSRDFARIEAPFSPAEEQYLLDYLAQARPAVIGISCIERTRPRFMGSLAKVKAIAPEALYLAGGIDAAADPWFYLSRGIDLVVNGDGEIALATVLDQLRNGRTRADILAQPPDGSVTAMAGQARPAPSPERMPLPYYGERLLSLTPHGIVPLAEQFARPKHVQFVNRAHSIDMYTQRGCTHQCSFCAQDLMATYRGDSLRNARRRPLADVVAHIRQVRQAFPGEFVYFWDLDFLRKPKAELSAFAEEYGATVGLPFFIFVTEKTVNAAGVEIVRALARAGMKTINMGIQSGSERMLKTVYGRNNTPAEARRAIEIIDEATRDADLEILYDVITYNPQEAPDEIRATIELVAGIPVGGRQLVRLSTHKMSFNTGQTFRDGGAAHTSEDYQDFKSNAAIYDRTQSPYLSWLLGQAMRGSITAGRLGSVRRDSLQRLLDPAYVRQMDDNRHLGQPLYEAFVPLDSDAFVMA